MDTQDGLVGLIPKVRAPIPLDTKNGLLIVMLFLGGDSGEYTYVNEWHGHEIAYHVSSLIPSRPGDRQQIQKKRHIGNGEQIGNIR